MKVCYVPKQFNDDHAAILAQANEIIELYQAQGFKLTLRQLYYQFVARDLLPNTLQSYKRLGSIVSDGRRAGVVDWSAIEDRTRFVRELPHWSDPSSTMRSAARGYNTDRWADQARRLEVWIEKDALVGVFEDVCNELDIPLFSCRGYASDSEVWSAAQRFLERDVPTTVLHFGDLDPSGIDMTRDVTERLVLFGATDVTVRRLALNMDQVEEYSPPPNPAKTTDARYAGYRKRFGNDSWELDALEPAVLSQLVRDGFDETIDVEWWDRATAKMERERALVKRAADRWVDVVEFLGGAE